MRALILSALLLAGGCSNPAPERLRLTIGVHQVELESPVGWEHLDHGREQRFGDGLSQISVADLGPVAPDGFRREILAARELFRARQLDDSRTRLRALHLRTSFPSAQRWESFSRSWDGIRLAGVGHHSEDPTIVERAYSGVLAEIAALPRPDLETLVLNTLEDLGHDERHDIAHQEATAVSGRPGVLMDTWDRLSHAQRRRHLFVLNDGYLLVARMELGRFSEMEAAFDALVASLLFRQSEALGGS
jgi:hypothetical protein